MADRPAGRADDPLAPPAGEPRVAQATRALLARVRAEAGADAVIGWKIGINDPRMLRRLGLARSIVGALRRDAQLAEGPVAVPSDAKIALEAEVALFLARDVRAGTSTAAAAQALAGIAPALEVVDFTRLTADLDGAIACNVFHVAALIPATGPCAAPAALDGLRVAFEGGGADPVAPAAVLGPLGAIVALVAERLEAAGERLRGGDRILSGAFAPPLPLAPGERRVVRFGGLGSLAVRRDAQRVHGECEVTPGPARR